MQIQFVGDPSSPDGDMTQLYRWLMRNPQIARHCKIELKGDTEGAMGAAEILSIVVPNAISAGSLAVAYLTYRKALPKAPPAVINIYGGQQLIALPNDPEAAKQALTQAIEEVEGTQKPGESEGPNAAS